MTKTHFSSMFLLLSSCTHDTITRIASMFNFFTGGDPTHGLVDFLSESEAASAGLAVVDNDDTILLAVDDTTQLSPGQNRKSYVFPCFLEYPRRSAVLTDIILSEVFVSARRRATMRVPCSSLISRRCRPAAQHGQLTGQLVQTGQTVVN